MRRLRDGFLPHMKHPTLIIEMAVHLLRNGLTTREAKLKIEELYQVKVTHTTIAQWARKMGASFNGKQRMKPKPCFYCGSRTHHKHTCLQHRRNEFARMNKVPSDNLL